MFPHSSALQQLIEPFNGAAELSDASQEAFIGSIAPRVDRSYGTYSNPYVHTLSRAQNMSRTCSLARNSILMLFPTA